MPKLLELEDVTATACCAPLSGPVLGEHEAVELAGVFKALSDPVRLRLLNMIASAEDGESCMCDLTGSFELTAPFLGPAARLYAHLLPARQLSG